MSSIRESLEAAIEQVEQPEEVQEELELLTEEPEAVEEPEETEEVEQEETTEPELEKTDPAPQEEIQTPEQDSTADEKAPVSWNAKAREDWAKVPANARAQIQKREKEVNQVLQTSAAARNLAKQLNDTLSPYREGLIAAGVQDPMQAISTLFQVESNLRMGSAQSKAEGIANMIKQYGVDINMLDQILAGEQTRPSQNDQLERMIDERMKPFNNFMQQQAQTYQQQQYNEQQQAQAEVEKFRAEAEFLEDVRMDMADLIDMAAARGQQMTLQEAYQKACALNPQVSEVIATREKQKQLMNTTQEARRKKHASVSVKGSPKGQTVTDAPKTIREQLEQAWDDQLNV